MPPPPTSQPRLRQPPAALLAFVTVYLAGLVWLIGMAAGTGAQVAWLAATSSGLDGLDPTGLVADPGVFIVFALASQTTFVLGCAVLPLVVPPPDVRSHHARVLIKDALRLNRPRLRPWAWPLLLGANLFVWGATAILFAYLFEEPGEHLDNLTQQVDAVQTAPAMALTLLAVGIMPGLGEEAIFRGFVLRRLGAALPAWIAIAITSVLFALSHVSPQHVILIFPLGLWWTVISWRADSVWPGVVLHAANNSWTLLWAWFLADAVQSAPPIVFTALAALAFGCFCASIYALLGPGLTTPRPATPHTEPQEPPLEDPLENLR
ncbi:MAG: CPBP family intramembrane glutamic endopeptidase [Phycisphaerales bacterium JB037]